ncbi:MAG: SIMPL domain-containing protein [Prochlorotrichaceae cyanobacterium]|jgi:uncharacterized protein YggE
MLFSCVSPLLYSTARSLASSLPIVPIVFGGLNVALLTTLDPPPLHAQEIPAVLSVSGYGSEPVLTTLTSVQLGVEAQGKTPLEVQQEVAERSSAIVDYLKSQSVSKLQTQSLNLSPIYDYSDSEQRIVGYQASNIVSFRIETTRVGSLLDEAVQRGASRIDSMQFVATDEAIAAAQELALAEATQDAQRQADVVLRSLGLTRQAILRIEINNAPTFVPTPRIAEQLYSVKDSFMTPVVGGEQEVEAIVTLHISY